eukprot:CAMPEP_0172435012 /NCGR_PEP_ID=MMETSP1064-20121228/70943_1 /TAXON_ID=202472 /ORGANISM="Aulacoseira subarctica , Strain CCAP 1002/5" /LENGTH=115 /DNA_ID=CAMNT_0013183281 /DNA_START=397 /DNA_END=744 /DNA_ORIENTATION=-
MTDQYQYSNSTGTLTKFLCDNTTTTAALDARLIIHNVSVNAPSKRTLSFTIKAWATIKDVKDQIFARLAIPTSVQRLYLAGPLQNYSTMGNAEFQSSKSSSLKILALYLCLSTDH